MRTKFFIFILTGLIFAGALLLCSNIKTTEAPEKETETTTDELKISKSFKVSPGVKLVIKSSVADILVRSHEITDEIKVDFYAEGSTRRLKEFEVTFEEEENRLNITVDYQRKFKQFKLFDLFDFWDRTEIKEAYLMIYAPQNLDIEIKSSGGDIKIEKLSGKFNLSSAGGDIQIENVKGEIDATSSGGDLRIKNCSGSSELKTAGGDIIVSAFQGEIEANSSGGDITINKLTGSVEASSSGGDIKVDFVKSIETTKLSSSGGDIKIFAPADLNAYIDFKSLGGDIQIEFPIEIDSKSRYELKGKIGEFEKSNIIASTTGGDITLQKKGEEEI